MGVLKYFGYLCTIVASICVLGVPTWVWNFGETISITYTCKEDDWGKAVTEWAKKSPHIQWAISIWANESGFPVPVAGVGAEDNYALNYSSLIKFCSENACNTDLRRAIFVLELDCVENSSVITLWSKRALLDNEFRKELANTLIKNSDGEGVATSNVRNILSYLKSWIYVFCALFSFVLLSILSSSKSLSYFALYTFTALDFLTALGCLGETYAFENDFIADVLFFDSHFLSYCPSLESFFYSSNLSKMLWLSIALHAKNGKIWKIPLTPVQRPLLFAIVIALPEIYCVMVYFIPLEMRSHHCQPGIGVWNIQQSWGSIVSTSTPVVGLIILNFCSIALKKHNSGSRIRLRYNVTC